MNDGLNNETDENEKREINKSLADKINDLELYYADTVLPENLKLIYAQVQEDCSEFRNNVFFKMLDIFENDLGKFGGEKGKNYSDEEHERMLREIKSTEQLLNEYTEKCQKYSS